MGLRHPWANKTAAGTRERPTGGLGTKQGGGLEGFGEKRVVGEEVIIPRYITGLVIQRVFSWMEAFPSPLPIQTLIDTFTRMRVRYVFVVNGCC